MRNNIVQLAGHMTTWRMGFACWLTKAKKHTFIIYRVFQEEQ